MSENTIIKSDNNSRSPMSEAYGYHGNSEEKGSLSNNTGHKKGFIKKYLPFIWEFLKIVIIAVVIVLPIRYFLFQPFIVKGESMVPNLQSGDYLIVDEISY